VRATLNDELMHEAGFEVASYEARERRRRLRRVGALAGLTVGCAVVAAIEFVRTNARLGAGSVVAMVIGVVWFLRAVLADDDESKS